MYLIKPGEIMCRDKEVISVQMCHFAKTNTISVVERMNGGLFDRAMKCKLCRYIDKLWRNKHRLCFISILNKIS